MFGLCTQNSRYGEKSKGGENQDNAVGGDLHGRKISLNCQNGKAIGLAALVAGVLILALALVLASGVVGGGKMGFISAGLVVGSMVAFGIAAYCLLGITPKKGVFDQFEEKRRATTERDVTES